ncbi:APC family permease [Actinoplanes sp. ATCC 53533]|uniref:APC family permease n=1 Tax=Actinoplanes sp. ATCC 53533 TaxID=1288362 RepID=UPI000F79576F|nr:APC family permease [Actinoplanes sp. ATCC 53533]
MTVPVLERKQMIMFAMWAIVCAAAGPLINLQFAIPAAYAATGILVLPLVYVMVGAVLALLSVGYTAMARLVAHPAVYYAVISRGLGRPLGVAAGMLSLLAYNAIQTSLYGLVGQQLAAVFGGPWWLYALLIVGVVAAFGMRGITRLTVTLAVGLSVSMFFVVLFDAAAVANPGPGGVNADGFAFDGLIGAYAVAAVYPVASLMGFEAGATFTEEARHRRGPGRAVFLALAFLVVVNAVSAWTTGIGAGTAQVTSTQVDPLTVFDDQYGPIMPPYVRIAVNMAIVASMIALHAFAARYAFAMACEGVLPRWVRSTGRKKNTGQQTQTDQQKQTGAPVGGSVLQSGVAVLVIAGSALGGADPVLSLFVYLSALGALCLMLLLVLSSVAAWKALPAKGPEKVGVWTRRIAPGLGIPLGGITAVLTVVNVGVLLPPGSQPMLILLAVVVVFVGGLIWGLMLRRRPGYDQIGQGRPGKYDTVVSRLGRYPV